MYRDEFRRIVARLKGRRFVDSRRQLADGEFSIEEFVIKGKNPTKGRKQVEQRKPAPMRGSL